MADTIAKLVRDFATSKPDLTVQWVKDRTGDFHARELEDAVPGRVRLRRRACTAIGVQRGDHVGIVSDNMPEWLVADLAMQCIGAADVPRGSDSTVMEIEYILEHAECAVSLAENQAQLEKILSVRKSLKKLKTLIIMDPGFPKGWGPQGRGEPVHLPGDAGQGRGAAGAPAGFRGPADRGGPAGGAGHDHLHLRDHRRAQGGDALQPQLHAPDPRPAHPAGDQLGRHLPVRAAGLALLRAGHRVRGHLRRLLGRLFQAGQPGADRRHGQGPSRRSSPRCPGSGRPSSAASCATSIPRAG